MHECRNPILFKGNDLGRGKNDSLIYLNDLKIRALVSAIKSCK